LKIYLFDFRPGIFTNWTYLPNQLFNIRHHFWSDGTETREIVWKPINQTTEATSFVNQIPVNEKSHPGLQLESDLGQKVTQIIGEVPKVVTDIEKLPTRIVLIILVCILIVAVGGLIVICIKLKRRRRKALVSINQHFHDKDSPNPTHNLLEPTIPSKKPINFEA